MKKALALIILIALLLSVCALSSCGLFFGEDELSPDIEEAPAPAPYDEPGAVIQTPVQSGDGKFSLRFNSNATLNPLVGTDASNMALSTLMYEGLFRLGSDFGYENALCESFETSDCITYDFKLRDGIYMSDGAELSPYDVVYSINTARSNRYASRLKNVESVSISDINTVRVVLSRADARFPRLLDFGIIKDGSSGTAPRGTGSYKFAELESGAYLIKNDFHEKSSSLPVSTIFLLPCADTELGERFTESIIDLFIDDPSSSVVSVRRDHEKRYFNTTVLQYIGFSSRSSAIVDPRFRAVVQFAADKDAIVNDVLDTRASAARLALPTFYSLYDTTWETTSNRNSLVAMSDLLDSIGMYDANNDTFLEYPLMGDYVSVDLVFIVNSENQSRAEAAGSIADQLRRVGINVELLKLPYDEYIAALEAGEFDMYYGETRLPANFDFSELVSPGGALDYGNMGAEEYVELNSAFLAAWGEFAERNAARALCTTFAETLPFVPIAYKQYAVHSGRNEILGMEPSQTGLFWNIYDWEIDIK